MSQVLTISNSGGSAKREREVCHFLKREAMLMAITYSYELKAQNFDVGEVGNKNTPRRTRLNRLHG